MSKRSVKQSKSLNEGVPIRLYRAEMEFDFEDTQRLKMLINSGEVLVHNGVIYGRVNHIEIDFNIIPDFVRDDLASATLECVRTFLKLSTGRNISDMSAVIKHKAEQESGNSRETGKELDKYVKQMPLPQFEKVYGMHRKTVERLIHTHSFPAYKLGSRWYIDIQAFEKWREQEHRRQYKYAK